ncbi:hypothetical protein GCM10027592_36790 [Spirosoma flavus]
MITADTRIKANFNNAKILIVEHNDDQWKLFKSALQQSLREVTTQRVATIQEAKALLNSWQEQEWELPKLILLDLYLPRNIDGWELIGLIKSMPGPFIRIPIIVYGPSDKEDDVSLSYERGAATYLTKPLTLDSWQAFCQVLRSYWWETVSLPPIHYDL